MTVIGFTFSKSMVSTWSQTDLWIMAVLRSIFSKSMVSIRRARLIRELVNCASGGKTDWVVFWFRFRF